jgi:hypothetical protein
MTWAQFTAQYGAIPNSPQAQQQALIGPIQAVLSETQSIIQTGNRLLNEFGRIQQTIANEIERIRPMSLGQVQEQIFSPQQSLALAQANNNFQAVIDSVDKLTDLYRKEYELKSRAITEQIQLNRRLIDNMRSVRESLGSTLLDLQFGSLAREIGGTNILEQTRAARARFLGLVQQARGATGENLVGIAQEVQQFAGTLLELGKIPAQQVPEFRNLFDEVFGALQEVQSLVGSQQSILEAEGVSLQTQLSHAEDDYYNALIDLQEVSNQSEQKIEAILVQLNNKFDAFLDLLNQINKVIEDGKWNSTQYATFKILLEELIAATKTGKSVVIDGKEIAKVTRQQSRFGTPILTDRR